MGSGGSTILGENKDIPFLFLDPRDIHLSVESPGPLPRGRKKDVWGSGVCAGAASLWE